MSDITHFYHSTTRASPYQYCVEVADLPVQPLSLNTSQTKPNSEEHQGESRHPCKHEADRPQVKPDEQHTAKLRLIKEKC